MSDKAPRITKDQKEKIENNLSLAFRGDYPAFSAMIEKAGYVHPGKGIKQRDLAEVIPRKTLRDLEIKGKIESVVHRDGKFYPIIKLIAFIWERNKESDKSEDLKKWNLSEAEFKAKERKLKYEVEAGYYIEVDEVKKTWCEHIASCRKRLLAIPRAMASRLVGQTSRAEIERQIKEDIYSALEELSDQ